MEDDTRRLVGFFTAQFVFVAALVHLALGVVEWLTYLSGGILLPGDARWPVFVVSGLAIMAGIYFGYRAENRRPFYLAGIVVMLGYVLGYFGWHYGGHRLLLVAGPRGGPVEAVTVEWFLDHLFAGPIEFLSILVETLAAVGLGVLFATEGGREDATEGEP